jgi:hypothetical protein
MSENKLLEERKARSKQLEDMEQMHQDLLAKIKNTQDENSQLEGKIKDLEEVFEFKAGKLDYILEQKEALFNMLQLAIAENKEFKNHSAKKNDQGKKKGLFSSLLGYFQQDNYSTIDVSQGKVKKSEIDVNPKNLVKQFNNPQSFYSNHDAFDNITAQPQQTFSLPKLIATPEQPVDEVIEEPLHEAIEEKFKQESNHHTFEPAEPEEPEEHHAEEEVGEAEEEHDGEAVEVEDEHEGNHEHNHDDAEVPLDDQSEDMLKIIRENFNILPE